MKVFMEHRDEKCLGHGTARPPHTDRSLRQARGACPSLRAQAQPRAWLTGSEEQSREGPAKPRRQVTFLYLFVFCVKISQ